MKGNLIYSAIREWISKKLRDVNEGFVRSIKHTYVGAKSKNTLTYLFPCFGSKTNFRRDAAYKFSGRQHSLPKEGFLG